MEGTTVVTIRTMMRRSMSICSSSPAAPVCFPASGETDRGERTPAWTPKGRVAGVGSLNTCRAVFHLPSLASPPLFFGSQRRSSSSSLIIPQHHSMSGRRFSLSPRPLVDDDVRVWPSLPFSHRTDHNHHREGDDRFACPSDHLSCAGDAQYLLSQDFLSLSTRVIVCLVPAFWQIVFSPVSLCVSPFSPDQRIMSA